MSTMSINSPWQRSALGYRDRFVNDFVFNSIRVRQFPCKALFEKAIASVTSRSDETFSEIDDFDRVPDTAFTVWESSVLLGIYLGTDNVWKRFQKNKRYDNNKPIVILELGAGSGVASLLLATSDVIKKGPSKYIMTMTDLPTAIEYTKLNINANLQKIPQNITTVTTPVRWGNAEDIESLPRHVKHPDIVLGADLLYTCDKTVISALAETVSLLTCRVAVFAVCKLHRPESITFFLSLVQDSFEIRHVPASSIHDDLFANDDDFVIVELWRKRCQGSKKI